MTTNTVARNKNGRPSERCEPLAVYQLEIYFAGLPRIDWLFKQLDWPLACMSNGC